MINKIALENLATDLRETLEISSEVILNPNQFNELCQKIEKHEDFKIAECQNESFMVLENDKYFTIYLCGNQEKKFYDLVKMLSYALLIDKEKLTAKELKHKVFYFNLGFSNKAVEYFMRAFMMPEKAFLKTLILYEVAGDGSSVNMIKMR